VSFNGDGSFGSATTIYEPAPADFGDLANGGLYPMPEPSSLTLLGLGIATLALRGRTRRRP
jgi:hypothetical protein